MPWSVQYPVNFSPSGDTTSQAFMKHIEEIKKIYGFLNTLNSEKLSASDLSSSLSGINTNLTTHINSTNPHPNYKPSVSFSDITGTLSLSDTKLTGSLPMSRITGNLDASRISNLTSLVDSRIPASNGDGITQSDFSNSLFGYIKFKNGFILQWGRVRITPAEWNANQEGNYDVLFSPPFSTACYTVTAGTEIDTSNNVLAEVVFQVKNITKTGFDLVPQVFYGSTDGFKNWNNIYANYIALGK